MHIDLEKGDCLELLKDVKDQSIELILTDLPYGVTNCKWDSIIDLNAMWKEFDRICNGTILLFATQPFLTQLINTNDKDFRYVWYWEKNNVSAGILSKKQPMRKIEEIAVFYKKFRLYNPQGLKKLKSAKINNIKHTEVYGKKKNPSIQKYTNYPNHLLKFKNVPILDRLHSTQKPVELLEYLIKTYTNAHETVLDCCMGSGSTAVACFNTDRNFIGMELNNNIYNTACTRVKKEIDNYVGLEEITN